MDRTVTGMVWTGLALVVSGANAEKQDGGLIIQG